MPAIKDILRSMDYGPAPEAAGYATAWLEAHGRSFDHFIGGAFVPPAEGLQVAVAGGAFAGAGRGVVGQQ